MMKTCPSLLCASLIFPPPVHPCCYSSCSRSGGGLCTDADLIAFGSAATAACTIARSPRSSRLAWASALPAPVDATATSTSSL